MSKIPVRPSQAKNTSTSLSTEEGPELEALAAEELEGMRLLGFTNPGTPPTEESSIPDLLLYGLVPYSGSRPDYGIVIGVAAELEALVMFIEGPLGIALEMMARRLRVAVDIAKRANTALPPETA